MYHTFFTLPCLYEPMLEEVGEGEVVEKEEQQKEEENNEKK